jgi:hypothetical protein
MCVTQETADKLAFGTLICRRGYKPGHGIQQVFQFHHLTKQEERNIVGLSLVFKIKIFFKLTYHVRRPVARP